MRKSLIAAATALALVAIPVSASAYTRGASPSGGYCTNPYYGGGSNGGAIYWDTSAGQPVGYEFTSTGAKVKFTHKEKVQGWAYTRWLSMGDVMLYNSVNSSFACTITN